MKTSTRRVAVVVAAGVLGLGGLAVAAPAVAAAFGGPSTAASPGPNRGDGDGPGMGMNGNGMNGNGMNGNGMNGNGMNGNGMNGDGMGVGARDGGCLDLANLPAKGTLTESQQRTLVAMAQEEKLAHDLYVAFGASYDAVVFDRIAASETQHLRVVRTLLERYGLSDPTSGKAAGQFSDPAVQATYDRLLAQGRANEAAALRVGQTVEQTDIDDLKTAQTGLTAADVRQVYAHLLTASQHHLTAFQR